MKKILSTISSKVLVMGALMTLVLSPLATVSAGYYGWNNSSGDCPTFVVANTTSGQGVSSGCWTSTSISAKENDVVYLTVYFANHTGSLVNNVRVKTSNIDGETGNVSNIGGTVYANGVNVASGSANITLAPNTKLVYEKTFVGYQGENYNYLDQGISASTLESSGVAVGPVDDNWNDQGNVKVKYRVVANGSTGNAPVVTTTGASVSGSTAVLNGDVATGNISTDVWFDIYSGATCATFIETVGTRSVGTKNGAFSFSKTGLSAGTYSYVAKGQNSAGPAKGTCVSFTINGGSSNNGEAPNVTTKQPDVSGNRVTLNGSYTSDDPDVQTTFVLFSNSSCSTTNPMIVGLENHNSRSTTFDYTTSSLAAGTYSYVASAANNSDFDTGQCVSFTISTGGSSTNMPSVTTNQVTGLDSVNGNATLNGYYNANGNTTRTCFEFDGNNIDPITIGCTEGRTGSGDFNTYRSGLSTGQYWYRATIYNSSNEKFTGEWTYFNINRGGSSNGTTTASATTYDPISYSASQATLSGNYNMGNSSGQTWFQWGPSTSLGNTTSSIARATGAAGNTSQTIYGLSANTTYYYRVVAQNANGTIYGDVKTFTTPRSTIFNTITRVITQPAVRTTRTVTVPATTVVETVPATTVVGGTGVKYLRLNIDNEQNDIARGESVSYEVQWENISSDVTLNDLVLEVTLPEGLRITDSSRGDVDTAANAIYLDIDQLDPREDGRMTIDARVVGNVRDNAPAVARAIMAFKNPTLAGMQENAIAYDSDRFSASSAVLGASAFGAGFLPGTLAGWLIIALIIILIILAARHYMRGGYYGNDDRDNGPYTPYRPQA